MKKLTHAPLFSEFTFGKICDFLKINELPKSLKSVLLKYGSYSVVENTYKDIINDKIWKLNSFINRTNLLGHLEELEEERELGDYEIEDLIVPFAVDEGGWLFCLGLSSNNYNRVFIYRCNNYDERDIFLKISESFEEFINNLQVPEKI